MSPKKRTKKTKESTFCTAFTVPDSGADPETSGTQSGIHIPSIVVTCNLGQPGTKYEEVMRNRFMSRHGHEKLALLSFARKVKPEIARKALLHGVTINGDAYSFLGCSSSGIKQRKCYMWKGTPAEVREILSEDGDFESIKIASKQISRIGLLFSQVKLTSVEISKDDIVCAQDFVKNGKNFSDGCGGIGEALAERVFSEIKGRDDDEDHRPSVYQVRIQGYKGVLAVDKTIKPTKILIRPSMKKFETEKYPRIAVCDYSRPYTFGHLNKQFIMLLSGLGVSDAVFEEKQIYYFGLLETMFTNSESAIRLLQWENQFNIAQIVARAGSIGKLTGLQRTIVMKSLEAIKLELLDPKIKRLRKLRILIPRSRNIFGICDPTGTLEYGECFLRITDSGMPKTVRGQVVVGKNPCYFLGDLRKLTALDETTKPGLSELHHLVDCIVFPNHGKQPHSHEIAGSDLDGDEYFVTWDEDLIPNATRPPYGYPEYQGEPEKHQDPVSLEEKVEYVSRKNLSQMMIGNLDTYFNRWADLNGVDCEECNKLGELFSRAIDAGKSGEEIPDVPETLIPPVDETPSRFIWSKMKSNGSMFEKVFKNIKKSDGAHPSDVTEHMVMEILRQKETNITPFQKFKFVLDHTRLFLDNDEEVMKYMLRNYIDHIDFSLFSGDQKLSAMDLGVPKEIMMNDLNRSDILSQDEVGFFRMDNSASSWSRLLEKEQDGFLWSDLVKTLTMNDNILLVLEMPNEVILVLQFQEKQSLGVDQPVNPGSILAILYSRHFSRKLRYNLSLNYFLDFTDGTPEPGKSQAKNTPRLQLYRDGNKSLTFVKLGLPAKEGGSKKQGSLKDARATSISLNLQRFDKNILSGERPHPVINREPFVRIEMYARRQDGSVPYWDTIEANDQSSKTDTASGR